MFHAQRVLGTEVVSFLRGAEAVRRAEFVSDVFFGQHDVANFKVRGNYPLM